MKLFMVFVKKELLHAIRDSKTMLILFGIPITQVLLFGFALTNEIKNSKIVVCDYANDELSHHIINKIAANKSFDVEKIIVKKEEIKNTLQEGNIKLVLVFPNNFHHLLDHSGGAQIQIIADASDPNTGSTLTSYINLILSDYQREMYRARDVPVQIIPEIKMLYNPTLKGATNFVPGVIALVLFLVCTLMTSVSVVREKELGTMEVLLASPMPPLIIITAKAVPYFMLSLINLTVILIMSVYLLNMPFNGSVFLLYAESSLFILCALSLGLLISNSTKSQEIAMLISLMGMLIPTLLLTGFIFPLENMPMLLQWIANVVPSKWYYIITKSIMIKGVGISGIWKETTIIVCMTTVLLLVSVKKFKIRLE